MEQRLTASAGWCAPSEAAYVLAVDDGDLNGQLVADGPQVLLQADEFRVGDGTGFELGQGALADAHAGGDLALAESAFLAEMTQARQQFVDFHKSTLPASIHS